MDSDDISEPTRLAEEVGFLEKNLSYLVVGSGYRSIDDSGRTRFKRANPMDDSSLRWLARFRNPRAHFSFRTTYPDGTAVRFDESTPTAQDYGLFADLLRSGRGKILSPLLVRYRMHVTNISSTRRREQNDTAIRIASRFIEDACGAEVAQEFAPMIETLYGRRTPTSPGLVASIKAFDRMIRRETDDGGPKERWMRRRAAGLLAEAYLASGSRSGRVGRATTYVIEGRRYIGPLGRRVLELKGLAPVLPGP
jgi:hypothetical protein